MQMELSIYKMHGSRKGNVSSRSTPTEQYFLVNGIYTTGEMP